jgi:hypothetical protein
VAGRGACDADRTTDVLVIGNDVAAFQHAEDLMLRSAPPRLSKNDDRHERPDPGRCQLIVQGQAIRIAPLGRQQPGLD